MEYSGKKISIEKTSNQSMNKINGGVLSISNNNFCNAERNVELVNCRIYFDACDKSHAGI